MMSFETFLCDLAIGRDDDPTLDVVGRPDGVFRQVESSELLTTR
jgi:hypothetical protein